ncbi:outer membrane lipoprotein carrier protein [Robbsia andropogonis]|uniref:outer membrane lipoprotein chaperone LolA n=1 Tax=Robbsia andropogonis TaxID=28092 RepID=UPI0020A0413A|nr:outer membrane lipoprotein chaperone LolA [Robbsia andropogonis]MCP1116520.1 outer membrane lipoprotein chaperone LolA [Robbsia andropogonis]MCP1126801.1 outer membrane lipoprotein chaperone LolA [Robbsia andropogonis]
MANKRRVFRGAVRTTAALLFSGALMGLAPGLATVARANGVDELHTFVSQVKSASGEFTQRQLKPVKGSGAKTAAAQSTGQGTVQAGGDVLEPAGSSSGTFTFARPGKFIWEYQQPYQQLLQADGKTLYVYDKDLAQVTERTLGSALGASPAAILFGSNDLDKNFTVNDGGSKGGMDWVELVPKTKDTQFKRIGIGFQKGRLNAMELYDVFGNVTLLSFQNLKENPSLKADAFSFVVPKGADVIKG